jgi:hypothetical protein
VSRWVASGLAAGVIASLAALVLARAWDAGPGPTPSPARDDESDAATTPDDPVAAAAAAGSHLRVELAEGPVHLWRPAGYHADTAQLIVYVHGYYTDVDAAWLEHQLPAQFALSAVNAWFVAVPAPRGGKQAVAVRDVGAVVRALEVALGEVRPSGPLVAIGHSGAYRTLSTWLDEPMLDAVVLLDARYGDLPEFDAWSREACAPGAPCPRGPRRLIEVGDDTVRWTEDAAAADPDAVVLDFVPQPGPADEAWPEEAMLARHVYVRSQFDHMALARGGVALPALIRLLGGELLPAGPWRAPLGRLPAPDAGLAPVAPGRRP